MIGFLGIGRHDRLRGLLSSYIDGQLRPSELCAVERHLSGCDECRSELESLRATVSLLGELAQLRVPRSFTLSADPGPAKAPFSLWPVRVAASAAAVLLVALMATDLLQGDRPSPEFVAPELESVERVVEVEKEVVVERIVEVEREVVKEAEAEVERMTEKKVEDLPLGTAVPSAAAAPVEEPVAEAQAVESVPISEPAAAPPAEGEVAEAAVATDETIAAAVSAEPATPERPATSEGTRFPFRQLEIAVGGLLVVLLLAILWTARRRRP